MTDWNCVGCGESLQDNGVTVQSRAYHCLNLVSLQGGGWGTLDVEWVRDPYSGEQIYNCRECGEEITGDQQEAVEQGIVTAALGTKEE